MLRTIAVFIILFTFTHTPNYGQNRNSPETLLNNYFEDIKKGNSVSITSDDLKEIPFQNLIDQTKPFIRDENPVVRYKAIDLIKRAGALSKSPEEREMIVALLIEACKDPDGGNSGVASKALLLYNLNDFSTQAIDSVVSLLKKRRFYYERIIRIAGFIQTREAIEALKVLKTSDSTLTNKEKWAVDLALARSGDPESLSNCMGKITGVPVNDKSVDYLFPDLVYMRQPTTMSYMLQEILSEEKKCRSSNPDKEEEIICAFKIMELVAPVIEDFPVKMTGYGELDIENYDNALQIVREWIKQIPSYHLIRYIY